MSPTEFAYVDRDRMAMANLRWDPVHGDRHTSMTVLVCGADPAEIDSALRGALLRDDEMADPASWADLPDPFGELHEDPCDDMPGRSDVGAARHDLDHPDDGSAS